MRLTLEGRGEGKSIRISSRYFEALGEEIREILTLAEEIREVLTDLKKESIWEIILSSEA